MISSFYMFAINSELSKLGYDSFLISDNEIHFFDIDDVEYQIYNNGNAFLINRLCDNNVIENLHIVPVMLSCSDTFVLSYIQSHISFEKKGQLDIFDFL